MRTILRGLDGLKIVSADIVEVAPAYDTNAELTTMAAADVSVMFSACSTLVLTLVSLCRCCSKSSVLWPRLLLVLLRNKGRNKFLVICSKGSLSLLSSLRLQTCDRFLHELTLFDLGGHSPKFVLSLSTNCEMRMRVPVNEYRPSSNSGDVKMFDHFISHRGLCHGEV